MIDSTGCQEAEERYQALRILGSGPFDLVITDLVMPDREGLETIREIWRRYPRVGIIAMSGAFGGSFLKTAEALGAADSIAKPVSPERLLAAVSRALAREPR